MTIDLTGGIDSAREYVLAECPSEDNFADSVSMWVFDDRGEIGLPRIGIEATGANWAHHGVQANVAFAGGRVLRLRTDGNTVSPFGPDGRPTILGAEPLVFTCVEPFRRWRMAFAGEMTQTSTDALIDGDIDGPMVPVTFEVEATMAVPPWEQGALTARARASLAQSEKALMGGDRYEQLFRAVGTVTVDGVRRDFAGSGLRIRRSGLRKLGDFRGHAWQTAVFPSGKAFGYMAYPPRADGVQTFSEGFVFNGDGDLLEAEVVRAPWLSAIERGVEDVSLVLRSKRGLAEIGGETVVSTFDIHHKDKTFNISALFKDRSDFPALHQAMVRYTWDGEVAYGMIERSNPIGKITMPIDSAGER